MSQRKMKEEGLSKVRQVIEQEGFDYAFAHYSNFKEIKDKLFHEYRKKYLAARKVFTKYSIDNKPRSTGQQNEACLEGFKEKIWFIITVVGYDNPFN